MEEEAREAVQAGRDERIRKREREEKNKDIGQERK